MVRKDVFLAMSNDIVFDFTNLTDTVVGEHGVSDSLLGSLKDRASAIDSDLRKRRRAGELPFRDLPYLKARSGRLSSNSKTTEFVILG